MNYERINWENSPSTDTPLDADNLNKMDEALDTLNREIARARSTVAELEETAALLSAQIAGIIRLDDGSTTGDAELINGRIGKDGTEYDTLGNAIRGQVGALQEHIVEVSDEEPEEYYNKIWIKGDDEEIEIPTMEDLEEVTGELSESIESLDNKIGDLDNLETTEKSTLVGAINEVVASVPAVDDDLETVGDAADAKATGDALTELNERIDSLVGVPNTVRQAILALFNSGVYVATGLTDEISIIEEWASVHTTAIALSENSISFTEAGVHQLSAILTPSDTTDTPTWVSSDETVAVVSQSGLVTTVGNGSCVISAVIGTLVANCEVSVSGMIVMHTITNTLAKADNSNSAIVIGDGEDYSAELTANTGYELLAGNVSITMNGIDITSTAYLNGLITINNVDGPIVITASATLKGTNLMKPVNSTNWNISTHLTISDVDGNDFTGTVKDSYGLSWNAPLFLNGLTEKSDTLSGKTVFIECDVEISGSTSSTDSFILGLTAFDRTNPSSGSQRKGTNGASIGCKESGHYSREISVSETDIVLSSSYYVGLYTYFYGPQGFKAKVSNAVVTYY